MKMVTKKAKAIADLRFCKYSIVAPGSFPLNQEKFSEARKEAFLEIKSNFRGVGESHASQSLSIGLCPKGS